MNRLGQDARDQFAMHIGQTHVPAAESIDDFLVIEAEEVKHRRVKIVHKYFIFDGMVAVIVGRTMNVAALDAAAGQPNGKAERIVIAAVAALGHRRATKLAGPQDER